MKHTHTHTFALVAFLLAPSLAPLAQASHQALVLGTCVPQASTAGLVTSACSTTSGSGTTGGQRRDHLRPG